ncbi:MAG: hypothetical protein RMK92_06460 [Armatimonadota bacterium]|nr:hypothetical protein [Armatimonadota bacterium]MDW8104638.1 hypothetical protein [Armatimonadota bacterium]
MIRELGWKPDFGRTVERFEAWWHGEILDRPPVTLHVLPSRPYRGPVKQHARLRERWMDVEYVVDAAIAWMECCDYVGDAFPLFWPNLGPEITATLFGCELEFSKTTSWSKPVVHEAEGWHRILQMEPDFSNPYWQTVERMTDYAIQRCEGRYVVGITDLHGNYDILAALRDPQALCLDMVDAPDLIVQVGRHAARAFVQAFERSYEKVSASGFGSTTWTPAYYEGRFYVPSCDFWLMVSPEMAREMILPCILQEMEPLERSIFHLDGVGALKHLHLLLEIPHLQAIQWVYGAGQGPAARWIDVYRQCLQAGKSVQVLAETAQDALRVLEAVGAKGVWLTVSEAFRSVEEAEAFLRAVAASSSSTLITSWQPSPE